jgi:hypothetical protein
VPGTSRKSRYAMRNAKQQFSSRPAPLRSYSNDRAIAALVTTLVAQGWRYSRAGRHGKLRAPDNALVIVPCTPSDRRSRLNFAAQVRRVLQGMEAVNK